MYHRITSLSSLPNSNQVLKATSSHCDRLYQMTIAEILPRGQLPQRKTFRWRGKKIAYLDIGRGPTVFCLPGWLSPSVFFLPLYYAFSNKIRLVSLDFPGWAGQSDSISNPNPDFFLDLIDDFIEHLQLRSFTLVGYSYGGMLSQFVASTHAPKVKKLILISPPADLETVKTDIKWPLSLYSWLESRQVPFKLMRQILRFIMLFDFFRRRPYFWLITHDYFQACINESSTFSVRAAVSCLLNSCRIKPAYHTLRKIPTILIKAASEPVFIERGVNHLRQILNVEPIIIPNTDHNHVVFDLLTHRELSWRVLFN